MNLLIRDEWQVYYETCHTTFVSKKNEKNVNTKSQHPIWSSLERDVKNYYYIMRRGYYELK